MVFALLPTLRPGDWRATICVRVCRKWEYRGGTDDGPINHVDLVLVDEQGNSLYGEIPGPEVDAKSPLIEEDGIYVIGRFRVSNAKSAYRPIDARYMVEFTLHATISAARTDFPGFPKYAYNITPISGLPAHVGDTKNFIDTIGTLVEVSDIQTVHLPNKPAPTLARHIVLRDISYSEIKITLWGQRATTFSTEGVYDSNQAKPIVVLFVGGLMKSYQGNCYLSGNAASRWYFNPDIPEARQFYESLNNQRLEIRSVPAPVQRQSQKRAPANLEEKKLDQLNGMDPYEFADDGYRCTITIGNFLPNATWWFPSCTKCSKSCVPDGVGYKCIPCSNILFKFKYKLCFLGIDETGEAEMVCFGDIARRIVGKPVDQLLRTSTSGVAYPPDITKLVNLRFTFAVKLTQQSFYRAQKTYNVVSLVTSHGQHVPAPDAAGEPDHDHSGAAESADSSTKIFGEDTDQLSPASAPDGLHSSPDLINTPPPSLATPETPVAKKHPRGTDKATTPSRKKLQLDKRADTIEPVEDDRSSLECSSAQASG